MFHAAKLSSRQDTPWPASQRFCFALALTPCGCSQSSLFSAVSTSAPKKPSKTPCPLSLSPRAARHGLWHSRRGQRRRRLPLQPPRRIPLECLQRPDRILVFGPPLFRWRSACLPPPTACLTSPSSFLCELCVSSVRSVLIPAFSALRCLQPHVSVGE